MYKVRLSPRAERSYAAADGALAKKLVRCFQRLEENPRGATNIRALRGPLTGLWRFRVGDYRVVYRIDDEGRLVYVLTIAHRRNAYSGT
jgi:mRNA interferase RelE/StbE